MIKSVVRNIIIDPKGPAVRVTLNSKADHECSVTMITNRLLQHEGLVCVYSCPLSWLPRGLTNVAKCPPPLDHV